MKTIRYRGFIGWLALWVISCQPIENVEMPSAKAVVEAYLSPNKPIDLFITKELPFGTTNQVDQLTIDDLEVQIQVDGKSYLLQPQGKGRYTSAFLVDTLKIYKMSFEYDGNIVSAETRTLSKPKDYKSAVSSIKITSGFPPSFPDPVKLTWSNPDGDYFLVVAKNIETNPEETISGGPFGGGNNNPARQFRSSPAQTSSTELAGPNFTYYGRYDVILYKINAEYAALYSDNGSSSINLSQPFTNITNGLGIFTGLASDTIRITVTQ
jgi:hypothetical protein